MSRSDSPAQRRRKARMREAVKLREEGFSLRAIARHLGVDDHTVRADLLRAEAAKAGAENSAKSAEFPAAKFRSNVVPMRRTG